MFQKNMLLTMVLVGICYTFFFYSNTAFCLELPKNIDWEQWRIKRDSPDTKRPAQRQAIDYRKKASNPNKKGNTASNLNNKGKQAHKAGKWKQAIEYYEKALKKSPNDKTIKKKLLKARVAYEMSLWLKETSPGNNALKNSPNNKTIKQNLLDTQKEKLAAKIKKQKDMMLKLQKQFKAVSAKINSTSASHNIDKLVCEQNELFVKIMNTSIMTYAEKRKYKLKLPALSKTDVSDYYKDAKTLISTSKDFFQGNLYNFNIEVNPNGGTKGLINITHRKTVEVSGEDKAQRISKAIDFIIGKIRLPRASFAVDGGRIYSNVAYNALDRFMNDAMAAVGGHHDSKKFWKEYYDSLSTGQKTILNWIKFKK